MAPSKWIDIKERLIANATRNGECLRWNLYKDKDGYGKVKYQGKFLYAHRVSYSVWLGPIPNGYQIDHVLARGCRYRDCIEPSHLEAVTPKENVRREPRVQVTQCPHGHPYSPENTMVRNRSDGRVRRECRECRRIRNKLRNRRING